MFQGLGEIRMWGFRRIVRDFTDISQDVKIVSHSTSNQNCPGHTRTKKIHTLLHNNHKADLVKNISQRGIF